MYEISESAHLWCMCHNAAVQLMWKNSKWSLDLFERQL